LPAARASRWYDASANLLRLTPAPELDRKRGKEGSSDSNTADDKYVTSGSPTSRHYRTLNQPHTYATSTVPMVEVPH
jgi:hypothetical protein